MSDPQTTDARPLSPERMEYIYQRPLSMTMGEFVVIWRLADERLRQMEEPCPTKL